MTQKRRHIVYAVPMTGRAYLAHTGHWGTLLGAVNYARSMGWNPLIRCFKIYRLSSTGRTRTLIETVMPSDGPVPVPAVCDVCGTPSNEDVHLLCSHVYDIRRQSRIAAQAAR